MDKIMASMKVKVSKVMAQAIAKAMKERGMEFENVSVQTFNERGYVLSVAGTDGMYEAQVFGDYIWSKDEYKAIQIVWPWHYYAMPTYLTTAELLKVLRGCAEKNIENFMNALCNKIAI